MTAPRRQRVAAYLVCVDSDDRLLLVRLSDMTTHPGWWTLPGGGIDFGEHPEAAAVRELREETGLEGEIRELLSVESVCSPVAVPGEGEVELHRIRIVYRADIVGGALVAETHGSSDDADWFTRDEVAQLDLVDNARMAMKRVWR